MDDPFNQNNPTMPNVSLIDDDFDGPDNRPTAEAPVSLTGTIDASGKARVTFTVSMQPGNNYRAGASCLSDAPADTTQIKADSVSFEPEHGDFSGYKAPLQWSQMLTVWRKLHVETDTMVRPELSATQVVGTVASIAANSPVAGQSVVNLGLNLPDEFSDLNLYEGGDIVFANCPVGSDTFPVLLNTSTSNPLQNDTVTINGIPGACANGSAYTLMDDDDILVLPHFPDFGQIGVNAFAGAYVVPENAGTVFQTTVAFDRHLDDTEIEFGTSPWDDGCTLLSNAAYWACCVVGCWEPSQNMDYDPDPCPSPAVPGSEGKDGGITDDDSGASAIFLQVIVDDFACTFSSDESHIVTHEIVHTSNSHPQHVPQSIMDDGAPKQFNNLAGETIVIIRSEIEW